MNSVRTLLAECIDYAGLFPPAALDMCAAVRNYATYRESEHAWALGRFIVPAARFRELTAETNEWPQWKLSFLGRPLPTDELAADTVEVKVDSAADIQRVLGEAPEKATVYFEIPVHADSSAYIEALTGTGARAKIRTGGLSEDMFPSSVDLAHFLTTCATARVPFKATAGLHHAIRSVHNFTYEPNSVSGVMHGFLNVFLAAASLFEGGSQTDAVHTLEETHADAFRFSADEVSWHGHSLSLDQIARSRREFAISFGSCSFEEPIADLRALGLL